MNQLTFLQSLQLPSSIIDVYLQKMDLSQLGYVQLRKNHAFPPCFIPIFEFGTAPSYRGLVRHFFVNRSRTFVDLLAYSDFHVSEYARTSEQFALLLFIEIVSLEEEWNAIVNNAADFLNIENARGVFERWLELEDDCLIELPEFKNDRPYSPVFYQYEYNGDFPFPNMNFGALESYSGVELGEFRHRIDSENAPPWINAVEQKPLFYDLLATGNYAGCWMSANSRGWLWKDLRDAVDSLAIAADNNALQIQVEHWQSHNHESFSIRF